MRRKQCAQLFGRAVWTASLLALGSLPVWAGAIPVPDGDFTDPNGAGSIGGHLLGGNGSSTIGSGPWKGTYTSLLGLALQPSLAITVTGGQPSGGAATISGLTQGVNAGNVIDSGGYFSQDLGMGVQANTTYTLKANVDAGAVLSADVLASNGVGIGLTAGGSLFADSTNAPDLLSITLLSGTCYQVTVTFTTSGVAPGGNLGIRLFDEPSGILSANLLDAVSFSNVTLSAVGPAGASTPEPGTLTMLFSGMACMVLCSSKAKRNTILAQVGLRKK